MNPYEVLNVPRDADRDRVKRAYRRVAKRAHPDAGGDPEAFDRVHRSYLVLSDPERRRRYDETGRFEDEGPDNRSAKIATYISMAFNSALERCEGQGSDPTTVDLVKIMTDIVRGQQAEVDRKIALVEDGLKGYRKIVGRFKRKSEKPNLIDNMIRQRVTDLEKSLDGLRTEVEIFDATLEVLADYRFRCDLDQPPPMSFRWISISTTA